VGQRVPIVALGLVGLSSASWMTLAQLGVVSSVWEPIRATSSQGLPLEVMMPPYPAISAGAFLLSVACLLVGGSARWKTHPWIVLASAAFVIATAGFALARFAAQFGSTARTSTLFVFATASAIAMVPLVVDEAYAAIARIHDRSSRFRPASYGIGPERHVGEFVHGSESYVPGGVGILVGVGLLLLGTMLNEPAAAHARVTGVIVAALGAMSLAEVTRWVRWGNVGIGLLILGSPLLMGYGVTATIHAVLAGLLLASGSTWNGEPAPVRRTAG
jgi:hypothetical protein